MALSFERINTRKIALAAEYGYTPNEVAEDGVDEDGITVLAEAYQREQKPSSLVSYQAESLVVHVQWETSEQADRARKARDDDWAETLATRGLKPEHL